MKKGGIGGLLAILLCLGTSVEADEALNEGLWEFDIHYNFIGVPQHFPGYVNRQCINVATPMPTISRPGQECNDSLQGRFGRTITWQVDCSTEWEIVNGMGRIHYMEEQAIGDVHLQVINPYNVPQPMLFRIRGKRLGDCKN